MRCRLSLLFTLLAITGSNIIPGLAGSTEAIARAAFDKSVSDVITAKKGILNATETALGDVANAAIKIVTKGGLVFINFVTRITTFSVNNFTSPYQQQYIDGIKAVSPLIFQVTINSVLPGSVLVNTTVTTPANNTANVTDAAAAGFNQTLPADIFGQPTVTGVTVTAAAAPVPPPPPGPPLAAGGLFIDVVAGRITVLNSSELYSQAGRSWLPTGKLITARYAFSMLRLSPGSALALGGAELMPDNSAVNLDSSELYSAASGTWAATGNLNVPRVGPETVLLQDGRALTAGGQVSTANSGGTVYLDSAELYNPVTGAWAVTGAMAAARAGFQTATLSTGDVLAAGGTTTGFGTLSSSEIYSPSTGLWSPTGALTSPRVSFSMVLLQNGNLLAAGGVNGATTLASTEVYNPFSGTWTSTGPMTTPRGSFQMVGLPNGNVLAAGGSSNSNDINGELASAEIYDVATGTWTATGSMATKRSNFQMVLLADGTVVAAGGIVQSPTYTASSEIYDPASGTWSTTGSLGQARAFFQMVAL
ncbi:galactose oxidase [Coccomyxa subellipsoidea C-169]|uniref:Galactose oxidase n=1 Tax=Coccomyxa subellipsoidea (strain C-169) TaxID=574566 RepID=I0YY38_COCSC|nr:galactose oxidase [Coccomyxa subellipsoidea C-169]EIE23307.1 galactose oxidase [Coccomyxa subellipsoidea C-169]|eukprot:XP_005647851.1 galactose oxidase [Coccomyxa subellipsoidea C-169]